MCLMCFVCINAPNKVIFLPCLSKVIVEPWFTVCACFVIKVLKFLSENVLLSDV